MTNEDIFRTRLETALRQLDWREGIGKAALIEHLAADPPAQQAMRHALVDGVYFSPADVLNSLPPGAWEASGTPQPVPTASPLPSVPPAPATPSATAAHPTPPAGPAGADLPAPLNQVPPPVLIGAAGTVAVLGFIAALVWVLRRLRES
jgi:hypothetical protein